MCVQVNARMYVSTTFILSDQFTNIYLQVSAVLSSLLELKTADGQNTSTFMAASSTDDKFCGVTLRTAPGRGMREDQKVQYAAERQQFLDAVIFNVAGRFPHTDLLDAMQVTFTMIQHYSI